MRQSIVLGSLSLLACADLVAPNTVALDRTYSLAGCTTDFSGFQPPPNCVTGSGGSGGTSRADSARVILRSDRTTTWMFGESRSGGTVTPGSSASTADGTYAFEGSNLILTLSTGTIVLLAGAPAEVERGWRGPDSLVFITGVQSYQNGRAILRPAN